MLTSIEAARPSSSWRDSLVTKVNENDVQLGRGRPVITSEGNLRFRKLILENKAEYTSSARHNVKDGIARRIIGIIAVQGGRFLRKLESAPEGVHLGIQDGVQAWAIVDEETSLQKVKQALREHESSTGADSKDSEGNTPGKKRKIQMASTATIEGAVDLKTSDSNECVAAPVRLSWPLESSSVSTATVVAAPQKKGSEHATERSPSLAQDANSSYLSPSQEDLDLLFRLKHPSLRKRDMMRLRRQQASSQDDVHRKIDASATEGDRPQVSSSFLGIQSIVGRHGTMRSPNASVDSPNISTGEGTSGAANSKVERFCNAPDESSDV